MQNPCLIFSLSNSRITTQGIEWLRMFRPSTPIVTVALDKTDRLNIVQEENALRTHLKEPINIISSLKMLLAIRHLRKMKPGEVFIIQDQRNILSWINAAVIGLFSRLASIRHIWIINHHGVVYETGLARLLFTNTAYFISYSLFILSGKLISFCVAKTIKLFFHNVGTLLSPKDGIEIPGWHIDTGWLDQCRSSVILMNHVIRDPHTGFIQPQYLEERPCPACGAVKWEFAFFSEDGFEFSKCIACGFAGACKVLNGDAFRAMSIAEADAARSAGSSLSKNQLSPESVKSDRKRFNGYLKKIESVVKPDRLLDIGCATGNSLLTAKKRGWQVIGIEQQKNRVELATGRGLQVLCGSIHELWDHPELKPGSFSAITMWETLEHVPDPEKTLNLILQLLKPGGVLAVTVDSYDSIDYRLLKEKHPACCGFGGYHGHINLFNARTLTLLFTRAGLQPREISSTGGIDLELQAAYANWAWNKIGSFKYFEEQTSRQQTPLSRPDSPLSSDPIRYPTLSPKLTSLIHLLQPWAGGIGNTLGIGSLVFGIAQKPFNNTQESLNPALK